MKRRVGIRLVQVGSEFSLRDGPTKEDYQEAERMLKDRPKLEKRWKEEAQKERPMSAKELKQLDRWLNDPKVGKQFQKEALEEKKAEQEKYDKAVEEFSTEETLAKRH